MEALAHSLNDLGRVDMEFIQAAMGIDEHEAISRLGDRIYLDPTSGNWETADQYLSGNVVAKLEQAKMKAEGFPENQHYRRSLEAIQEIQPERVPFGLLDFNLGERWIPEEYYRRFATDLFDKETSVNYFPSLDSFDTFAEQAACFLNQETGYRTSLSPMGIRLGDRLTGKPVHVDISDEPIKIGICTNRNKFILGPSGSGKSFFTNHMVRSYYEQGTHIVLVDVGHSYKGLCDMVNGYYFTYSEDNPIRFNPFFIGEGDSLDTEKKESIKTLLLALWKKDDEEFKRSEYVALSNAIGSYYALLETNSSLFPCFDTFYEFLRDHYVDVLKGDRVKEKDFDIDNFLYVLRPYYAGGEFDYLLNATENLNLLQERFIVFELDQIKDHPILFPVVTIIIMEVFINKMRKMKGIRKMILIEEAWKALMKEGFAEYIRYLFKTVRKFFGEAIVVTQEVEDIISSPVVKQAIINNSDCKILLDQSKYQNKFDASITTRSLMTEGSLRNVSRSDNNPHGFLIERWNTIDNRDLKTAGRNQLK